jgi:hypothetical protein
MRIIVEVDEIIVLVHLGDDPSLTLPQPVTPLLRVPVLLIDDPLVGIVETPDPGVIPETAGEAAPTGMRETVAVVTELVLDLQVGTADPDPGVLNETGMVVAATIVIIANEAQAVIVNATVRNKQKL